MCSEDGVDAPNGKNDSCANCVACLSLRVKVTSIGYSKGFSTFIRNMSP